MDWEYRIESITASPSPARGPRLRAGALGRPDRRAFGASADGRQQGPDHVGADDLSFGHDVRPMDDIAKFADVAGPVERIQDFDGPGVPSRDAGLLLLLDELSKVLGEQRDVVSTLGQ